MAYAFGVVASLLISATAPESEAQVGPGSYRWSLPCDDDAARPASSRATGMRNGEQET